MPSSVVSEASVGTSTPCVWGSAAVASTSPISVASTTTAAATVRTSFSKVALGAGEYQSAIESESRARHSSTPPRAARVTSVRDATRPVA